MTLPLFLRAMEVPGVSQEHYDGHENLAGIGGAQVPLLAWSIFAL
jgi:hypothetical protein